MTDYFESLALDSGCTFITPYRGPQHPHLVRCICGAKFTVYPERFKGEVRCLKCRAPEIPVVGDQNFYRRIADTPQRLSFTAFYIVENPDNYLIKFGVTNGTADKRLANHRRDGFTKRIALHRGLPPGVAIRIESKTIDDLVGLNIYPARGREYFPGIYKPLVQRLVRQNRRKFLDEAGSEA